MFNIAECLALYVRECSRTVKNNITTLARLSHQSAISLLTIERIEFDIILELKVNPIVSL